MPLPLVTSDTVAMMDSLQDLDQLDQRLIDAMNRQEALGGFLTDLAAQANAQDLKPSTALLAGARTVLLALCLQEESDEMAAEIWGLPL